MLGHEVETPFAQQDDTNRFTVRLSPSSDRSRAALTQAGGGRGDVQYLVGSRLILWDNTVPPRELACRVGGMGGRDCAGRSGRGLERKQWTWSMDVLEGRVSCLPIDP